MNTRHAIIHELRGAPEIYYRCGKDRFNEPVPFYACEKLASLATVALQHHATHAWVMPEIMQYSADFADYDAQYWQPPKIRYNEKGVFSAGSLMRPEGYTGRRQITVIGVAGCRWAEDNAWLLQAKPGEFLSVINEVESLLGVPITGTPAMAAWRLLKMLHPNWTLEIEDDLRARHFGPEVAPDLYFTSPVLKEGTDLKGMFLCKVDKGMAFTSAAGLVDPYYGNGTPQGVDGDRYEDKAVGSWLCTFERPSNFCQYVPVLPQWKGKDTFDAWVLTPHVRMMRYLGYNVKVHEGWIFPERHKLLEKWASLLWDARESAKSPYARGYIKQAANGMIGLTTSEAVTDLDKRRPDIRSQTIAHSVELVTYNIMKYQKLYGYWPLMVYNDALYYVLPSPNLRALMPEVVAREGKLGGYRYEGYIEITPEVEDILHSVKYIGKRLEALNKIGWCEHGLV
jgi:hypothetical protein